MSLDSLLKDIFYRSGHMRRYILTFSTQAFFTMKDCTLVASGQSAKKIKIVEVETEINIE